MHPEEILSLELNLTLISGGENGVNVQTPLFANMRKTEKIGANEGRSLC